MTERYWPASVKRTKQRERVYEILSAGETALSATELAAVLRQQGKRVSLSAIYRILEVFTANGMAEKTLVQESGTSIYELKGQGHRHYAICELCHKVIPMEGCPLESFLPELAERDFRVHGHRLQMFGTCGDCSRAYPRRTHE